MADALTYNAQSIADKLGALALPRLGKATEMVLVLAEGETAWNPGCPSFPWQGPCAVKYYHHHGETWSGRDEMGHAHVLGSTAFLQGKPRSPWRDHRFFAMVEAESREIGYDARLLAWFAGWDDAAGIAAQSEG